MPINTSSTGATYGKSSDPSCPLGFHPQVRWPTRCKRCFRDYREHSDAADVARYAERIDSVVDDDPWSHKRAGFQKSRSLDVSYMSGKYFGSSSGLHPSNYRGHDDGGNISSIDRRKMVHNVSDEKARKFGFIPGTNLHSSYTRSIYDTDQRLSYGPQTESTDEYISRRRREREALACSSAMSDLSASSKLITKELEGVSVYDRYPQRRPHRTDVIEGQSLLSKDLDQNKILIEPSPTTKTKVSKEESPIKETVKKGIEVELSNIEDNHSVSDSIIENKTEPLLPEPKTEAKLKKSISSLNKSPNWMNKAAQIESNKEKSLAESKKTAAWKKTKNVTSPLTSNSNCSNKSSKKVFNVSGINKSRNTSSSSESILVDTANTEIKKSKNIEPCSEKKVEKYAADSQETLINKGNETVKGISSELEYTKDDISFESAKANETTSELLRYKEKVREQEQLLSELEKSKKKLNLKIKDLESALEKRPQLNETQMKMSELQTKLKYIENKCKALEFENESLQSNVESLESELEEIRDNFKEDEVDEYRNLKRELENASKNSRMLSFKLKKAEKSISELTVEKANMEAALKEANNSSVSSSCKDTTSLNKIKQLETDLEKKVEIISKLEAQIKDIPLTTTQKTSKNSSSGPVLSRTASIERSLEDKLLKDIQDSVEREKDLKEQLSMAEDEINELRRSVSSFEDENETLTEQIKRMTRNVPRGGRRSESLSQGSSGLVDKDEGISADGEEMTPTELKVQLEVAEQESSLLRKKVETLLTDNLKLSKEIKDINQAFSEKTRKSRTQEVSSSRSFIPEYDNLQEELNITRIKLIEREREVERLEAHQRMMNKTGGKGLIKRSSSQEEDLLTRLNVTEQEASVLRERNLLLEAENERLCSEAKQASSNYSKYSKKLPASSLEKLQMDKFTLEEKLKVLESKNKDQARKLAEHEIAVKNSKRDVGSDTDRLKKEKISLETVITQLKEEVKTEKTTVEKLSKELSQVNEMSTIAQRDLISTRREQRKNNDECAKYEALNDKLKSELCSLNEVCDRLKEDVTTANRKNRDNLLQTQEGVNTFKEQINKLKTELQDERARHKECKKQNEENIKQHEKEIKLAQQKSSSVASAETEIKIKDLEEKWAKSKRINAQRKDKIEALENTIAAMKSQISSSEEMNLQRKLDDNFVELESIKKTSSLLKIENEELRDRLENKFGSESIAGYELLEENFVMEKAKLQVDRDDMEREYIEMKKDYDTIKGELSTLRLTYNSKADEWIREKLCLQKCNKDLEDSIRTSSGGEDWNMERNRFKQIIEDRDSQITQLKIEGEVARSQVSSLKRECEDIKLKLQDYEKMSRFQRTVVSSDTSASNELQQKFDSLTKQLSAERKDWRSETNTRTMMHNSKIAVIAEEVSSLKAQCSKYKRERETYKDMFESLQKRIHSGRNVLANDDSKVINEYRSNISDLQVHIHVLEDELSEESQAKAKLFSDISAQRSAYEIRISELNSRINELEEETIIDSGRSRIAGSRTKMELAWQKERESQKKLINELNTMCRDLKATLLDAERARDRERVEFKRKSETMRKTFDEEQQDTKKQITDLQYDLLELRDAHAKLRTTNDKLRREKEKNGRERDDVRFQAKERSRGELGEEKKLTRLISDMDTFLTTLPNVIEKQNFLNKSETRPEFQAFNEALTRLTDSKQELQRIKQLNENMQLSHKRACFLQEHEGGTPWRSFERNGSRESLNSNVSIPLPVPVRNPRVPGVESGHVSDATYNIRRLERDPSIDRLSTGSRESVRSTQSEWIGQDKSRKSKGGFMGKLKRMARASSREGKSNIQDSIPVQRSVSQERPRKNPNDPFDKYFVAETNQK